MRNIRRISFIKIILLFLPSLLVLPYVFWPTEGYAMELANRSVNVMPATSGAVSTHTFSVGISSSNAIGSIVFQYCSNSANVNLSCSAPPGLNVASANLASQSGNIGFIMDTADSNANTIVITRPAAAAAVTQSAYTFSNITNPSAVNQTTFVRITTYGSVDGSGSYIDNGSVAFSTENVYQIGAYVPPFLTMCVGVTVAPDCSYATGNSLNFGIMTPTATGALTSQFAAGTNEVNGYAVFVLGTTMTSGNNTLPALSSPTPVSTGISEFGFNLRRNTFPSAGLDPSGGGTATPAAAYNIPNRFLFVPGSQVASSPLSTDYNVMTETYIEDVSAGQAPGVYSTTLTYLATTQF